MRVKDNFYFICFLLSCLFIFLRLEIIFGDDIRAPFTDDFYYYLTTARNTINLGFITFDKISLTNGFQPLWFIIILFLKLLIKNEIFFNTTIIFTIFLFCFLTFINFKKFLLQNNYNKDEANFVAILVSYLSLFFSKNGMEIGMAVFLFSLSLFYLKKNILLFSIFSFITFLSRLEFIFFYFVILLRELFFKKKIFDFNYILKLSLLPILLIVYICLNIYFFQFPFPQSGISKSLVNELTLNKETFSFLFENGYGMRFISLLFYINCFGILLLFSKKISSFTKVSLVAVCIFFISNCLRSAWPLWTWHFFLLAISTPFILNDLIKILSFKKIKVINYLISIFFVVVYFHLFTSSINAKSDHIQNVAKKIESYYSNKNHSIFAMGDMAGKTSYLLNKSLIQLEGLTSGPEMIANIRNEKNLCDVLLDMNVDVYFSSKINLKNNMIYVEEPSINTKNAKKMRGILKVKPEKIFKSNSVKIYAFEINDRKDCFFE